MDEALLAISVVALDTQKALTRVALIRTAEALDHAMALERALNNRSAVMDAIAQRMMEIGPPVAAAQAPATGEGGAA
jgi:hypothetical protein